jgi:hypothetical protein
MTRAINFTTLALAAFAATTFLASTAEACISCNYVPEVVNTPSPYEGKRFQKTRIIAAQPQRATPPAMQRTAKSDPAQRKVETAQKTEAAKPIETAEATPLETDSRAPSASSLLESRGGASAETKVVQDKVAETVGCKKFFPTIGQTLTVPCE